MFTLALLAWPFPFLGRGCGSVVCWGVNKWITTAKDTRDVASLERDTRPGHEWYVTEVVWHRPTHSLRAKFDVDIHQTLYLPLMVFAALMVASRATFGHRHFRVRLEILGFLLLVLRALLRFVLLERWTDGLAHDGPFDMFLHVIQLAVAAPRGMAVAFPLILWFLLSRKALLAATAAQKA
jgi:hypothetical protein